MKSRSKLLKVGEVSEWLNVSRSTIYKWVHEGEFPEPVVLGQDDGKRSASRWKADLEAYRNDTQRRDYLWSAGLRKNLHVDGGDRGSYAPRHTA